MNLADLSDSLNPLVIKDVRQALRTRGFVFSFGSLLLGCVGIALTSFLVREEVEQVARVSPSFLGFLGCFAFVGFLVQPMQAFRTFAAELSSEGWQTLVLTGLTPRRILRGKIASTLVQATIYASATAPFILFSYFLGGIDLLKILVTLAVAFGWQIFLLSTTVCAATGATNRLSRGLLSILLGLALPASGLTLLSTVGFLTMPGSIRASALGVVLFSVLWIVATLTALFFESAAAQLADASNRSAAGPRIALGLHLAGMAVLLLVPSWMRAEVAAAAVTYGSLICLLFGTFASATSIPPAATNTGFARLLPSTSVGGFRTTTIALAVLPVLAMLFTQGDLTPYSNEWQLIVVAPSWSLSLLATVVLLGRGLFITTDATRRALVGLVAVGVLILGATETLPEEISSVLNPLLLVQKGDRLLSLISVMPFVALALAVLADRVLVSHDRLRISVIRDLPSEATAHG